MIINTNKKDEVIDLTEIVERELEKKGMEEGICIVFAAHTTCCVTTADLDPGTDLDLLEGLRGILPKISYRHPHDPTHAPDHILSSIIGPSVTIPVIKGELLLGVWQRIILIELDGPRQRRIHFSFSKS